MKKYLYTTVQRRALNIIWDAAGNYDYAPPFVAFNPHGEPEYYLDFIIGLSDKWFDSEKLLTFFKSYSGTIHRKIFDNITWLALENSLYEKELPRRPALKAMREKHARAFFEEETTMSRQEWMAKNNLLYSLLSDRWALVLGRKSPVLSPREKRISKKLRAGGTLDTDGLIATMRSIFQEDFLFSHFTGYPEEFTFHFRGVLARMLSRFSNCEISRTNFLNLPSSHAGEGSGAYHSKGLARRHEAADQNTIESCFGQSLYHQAERILLEHNLCTEGDRGCHLWYARGVPDSRSAKTPEAKGMAQDAEKQYQKNLAFYQAYRDRNQSTIRELKTQILNTVNQHSEPASIAARSGRLNSSSVWRAPVLHSSRIFERCVPEPQPNISVLLLLDASASRLGAQETIASQAYMISESLRLCRIPVEVDAFRTFRGFTVFQVLKSYREENSRGVFRYFSAGWNRDGLAMKAAEIRLKDSETSSRFLLVLTDANPNDSEPLQPSSGRPFPMDYSGSAGIAETARAVKNLKAGGVRISAVFLGEDSEVRNAEKIYSDGFVRIHKTDEISKAVGKLLQDNIALLS